MLYHAILFTSLLYHTRNNPPSTHIRPQSLHLQSLPSPVKYNPHPLRPLIRQPQSNLLRKPFFTRIAAVAPRAECAGHKSQHDALCSFGPLRPSELAAAAGRELQEGDEAKCERVVALALWMGALGQVCEEGFDAGVERDARVDGGEGGRPRGVGEERGGW